MKNIKLPSNKAKITVVVIVFMMAAFIVLVAFSRQDISSVSRMSDKEVEAMKEKIFKSKDIYMTVGKENCEYSTLSEALAAVDDQRSIIWIMDDVHTESDILVNANVTIKGFGADRTILQAAEDIESSTGRVFFIGKENSVRIEGLTIRHGKIVDVPRCGGGILNQGNLIIERCIIRDNVATYGVGIENQGRLDMKDCMIIGNSARRRPVKDSIAGIDCRGSGAGIKIERDSEAYISNCLIIDNTSVSNGGGIHVSCQGQAKLVNCTITKNTTKRSGGGVCVIGDIELVHCTITENNSLASRGSGVFAIGKIDMVANLITNNESNDFVLGSGGGYYGEGIVVRNEYNFIGDGKFQCFSTGDAKLAPLEYNGGLTMTYAIQRNSPAIDAIPLDTCFVKTDQRGVSRLKRAADIGAYERQGAISRFKKKVIQTLQLFNIKS